jgi:hypothetical protein
MPLTVVLDVILVTVRVPVGLPAARANAVRRDLQGPRVAARLRRAIRDVIRTSLPAAGVRVTLSR